MKSPISGLNKAFENRVRLGIMSILMVNEKYDFNSFRDTLKVTDGNLASHLKALGNRGLIKTSKRFIGRKPNTSYAITAKGARLFKEHLNALESLLRIK